MADRQLPPQRAHVFATNTFCRFLLQSLCRTNINRYDCLAYQSRKMNRKSICAQTSGGMWHLRVSWATQIPLPREAAIRLLRIFSVIHSCHQHTDFFVISEDFGLRCQSCCVVVWRKNTSFGSPWDKKNKKSWSPSASCKDLLPSFFFIYFKAFLVIY